MPPAFLTSAVDAVLADLQHREPIDLDVSFSQVRGVDQDAWLVSVREPGDGPGGVAFGIEPDEDRAVFLSEFADYLQDQFFPDTRQVWAQARPPCPGHTHPATASFDEGTGTA